MESRDEKRGCGRSRSVISDASHISLRLIKFHPTEEVEFG
jgi:hypothetical protein